MTVDQLVDDERVVRRGPATIMAGLLASAIAYPFLLDAFHATVGGEGRTLAASTILFAALWLAAAFAMPLIGLLSAVRLASGPLPTTQHRKALRLAYIAVIAPTAYVFMGVLLYMLGSPVPDRLVWVVAWGAIGAWALRPPKPGTTFAAAVRMPAKLRVAHGISAAVLTIYVLFHLTNHLFGLIGPDAHAAVMKLGRQVYRAPVVEEILVAAMLFQIGSGLMLAWRWSGRAAEPFRVFQVASGFYLSVFILGHMDSVFVFARTYLGIDTGWAFATGAPTGILHDPWNIRLLPHYWLGVFFVLSHLVSGLRVVLAAHGVGQATAVRVWNAGLLVSAAIATAILAGMCGLRLGL